VEKAERFVKSVLPSAVLVESFKQVRAYQIPQQHMDIATVFPRFLDKRALLQAGIEDWGLGQSSLEDVFINVCRRGVGGGNSSSSSANIDGQEATSQNPMFMGTPDQQSVEVSAATNAGTTI
jgi:hypothetical protein